MITDTEDMKTLMENDEGFQVFFNALVSQLEPKMKIVAQKAALDALRDARDSQ